MTRNISAPALSRNHAVPAGPTSEMSGSDSAEPSCTENIAATASVQAGTGSVSVRDGVMAANGIARRRRNVRVGSLRRSRPE